MNEELCFCTPIPSTFAIRRGRTASELAVEKAKSNSPLSNLNMLYPTNFAIFRSTTITKETIEPYTEMTNLPSGLSEDSPRRIHQKAPISSFDL
ncbi:hypothetical protein ACUXIS_004372 [Cytobacillus horneckiae]